MVKKRLSYSLIILLISIVCVGCGNSKEDYKTTSGFLSEKTVVAKSMEDILKYYDMATEKNYSEMVSMKNSGKIFYTQERTKVTVVPTVSKDIVAIVIGSGSHDLEKGFTFKKFIVQ